jgi:FAD/FMN-containing dehydrogenase
MDLSPPLGHVGPRPFGAVLVAFADEVGAIEPIAVVGGRSAWEVGGVPPSGVRLVSAPSGVVELDVAEMTVRVGAGTAVADLSAQLAAHGQEVAVPERPGGTIGGALVVGRSDIRRLGRGPVRDALLEATVVMANGRLVRCGGPTVKNVSGYDLCRLLVGSLGTLALVAEVVLRTTPRPAARQWHAGAVEPGEIAARCAPVSHLWDGETSWVLVEGHADDVADAGRSLTAAGMSHIDGPPPLPPHRWSVDPASLGDARVLPQGRYVAEWGVGIVHADAAPPARRVPPGVRSLNQRMKQIFDPTTRLNPGRVP